MSKPKVSICICTLDNYDLLHECLTSLKEHTSHIDYEVIIVDNGSKPRGYIHPMNMAMHAAEGDILVAFNDDIVVTPGWLDPLIQHIDGGGFVCFPDQHTTDGWQKICGWCIVFSRAAFEDLGGFDESFDLWCGDIDLIKRLELVGHPPVRIALPEPLIHKHGGTQTIGNQAYRNYMDPTGQQDIQRYIAKWGSDPNVDKFCSPDD